MIPSVGKSSIGVKSLLTVFQWKQGEGVAMRGDRVAVAKVVLAWVMLAVLVTVVVTNVVVVVGMSADERERWR